MTHSELRTELENKAAEVDRVRHHDDRVDQALELAFTSIGEILNILESMQPGVQSAAPPAAMGTIPQQGPLAIADTLRAQLREDLEAELFSSPSTPASPELRRPGNCDPSVDCGYSQHVDKASADIAR